MGSTRRIARFLVAGLAALWSLSAAADPAELHELAHDFYQWRDAEFPVQTSGLGEHRYDDRLTDYSAQAITAGRDHIVELLAKVKAMPTDGCSRDDRVDAILFRAQLEGLDFFGRTLDQTSTDP